MAGYPDPGTANFKNFRPPLGTPDSFTAGPPGGEQTPVSSRSYDAPSSEVFATPQERRAWYHSEATRQGVSPSLIDRVVGSEGGWSSFDTRQDHGTSFGPFAMHVAGTAPGTQSAGLGDEFRAKTGLDPSDPRNEKALAQFATAHIAQYGASPDTWHGLRKTPAQEAGTRPGEQVPGGGTYVGRVGLDPTGLSPVGAALLGNMLKDRYGAAEEPTGNQLLDGLLKSSLFGTTEQAPQPSPTDVAAKQLQQAPPPPPPPQTVPELQPGQSIPTPRITPIQQPAMPTAPAIQAPPPAPVPSTPMPGQPSVPSAPPPVQQPAMPPLSVPPIQPPQPLPVAANTGDNLLNQFLKQVSPISTAQAAEPSQPATPKGMVPGNIDLHARPVVRNPDGSISTVRSMSFNEDGKEVLIPTVAADGSRILTPREAIDQYHRTGQFLGKFDTPEEADQYGQRLHEEQAKEYTPQTQQQAPPANTGNGLLDSILKGVQAAAVNPFLPTSLAAAAIKPFLGGERAKPTDDLTAYIADPLARSDVDIQTRAAAGPPSPIQSLADLGGLVTPYLAGGAPGGAVSAGIRRPGGPRAEPPPLRVEPGAGGRPPEPPPPPSTAAQPPTNPPPGSPPPPLTPPPGGSGPIIEPPTFPDGTRVAADRLRLYDDLNWTVRSSYANAIESKQFYDGIPAEFKTPEFRAKVGNEIEQRLIDPGAPLSPETERFLEIVKPLTNAEHSLGTQLAKHGLTQEQAAELGISLRTVDQGHVHRMVEGQQLPGEILPTNIDPITGRPRSGGGRSLGTSASGMKQRTDYFVGQDDAGNRVWVPKRLGEQMPPPQRGYTRFYSDDRGGWVTDRDVIRKRNPTGRTTRYVDFPTTQAGQFRVGDAYNLPDAQRNSKLAPPEKYGDRYQQGHTSFTAREPTMREVEANTPIRYHHDYLLGLFNNVARLSKVLRNLNVIERQKRLLGPEGARLWQPREGRFLHTPPVYVDATGNRVPFERVNLPQLDGWAHPRIANTINDFIGHGDSLETTLERVLDHMTRSLFILPFGHIRNVGAHYTIGRGLDWAYRNPRLLQSFNEVWHMGPIYQRWLRENGPAMYPGAADVHGKLVEKLLSDMAHDPGWETTAKRIGTTMKQLLPEMYKWSSRSLWLVNDLLFLGRSLENLAKLGVRDPLTAPSQAWKRAIADTKREIPAYEMPDQVLGSRRFRNMLTRMPIAFGRYTKDKYEILGNNVVDMVGKGPHGKGMPQLQAAAQALITLMLSFPVMSVLNSALQRVTGNENAKVYGAGPMSIIRAAGGGIGKLAGVDPDSRLGWALGMTDDEIDLSHALSGVLTLTPGLSTFMQLFGGGHDPYTGQPMIAKFASPEGAASQLLTALASSFYPTEILVRALREGPGALFEPLGFNAAGYQSPGMKAQLMQKRMEAARERRSQFQDLIERGEQWGGRQIQQPGAVDYGRAGF